MRRIAAILSIILGSILIFAGVARRHARASPITSGVDVGTILPTFHPEHASGADKDTMVCPVCKYTANPAIQVWINGDAEQNVLAIASNLDRLIKSDKNKQLKAFVVYANVKHQPDNPLRKQLAEIASTSKLTNVALTVIGSGDLEAVQHYQINTDPRVRNTVFVYKKSKVSTKFLNLVGDAKGLAALDAAVNRVMQ